MTPTRLGLRLRVFLFFALLGLGGVVLIATGLYFGYLRGGSEQAATGFVLAGIISGFGLLALTTGIWLLFDEHVARPIDRVAAAMRTRAHAGTGATLDPNTARYLGDLAPAAEAVAGKLGEDAMAQAAAVSRETARLAEEKLRLTALLTEIPVAMILLGPDHRIVLYDGQAADMLSRIAAPRLGGSLFDYLEETGIRAAHDRLQREGGEVGFQVPATRGELNISARMRMLNDGEGYLLTLDTAKEQLSPYAARPLVYDFALLEPTRSSAAPPSQRPLSKLAFAVFDTETTGLLPHKDEIVQIAALRVLNGQIVPTEAIDMLVNPGRSIPASSTRVHGITNDMVADAPGIDVAARRFHDFARDAVIVAHNAPFDMAFLRRHDARLGLGWDHPVLDTVLLSAVLFGAAETHTLDALCDRLGITIPEALRHTAMGDTRATAEAFCAMLPMLHARGLDRFDKVIAETRRHGRLLQDLN